ncbi:MAG: hypothetical protein IJQ55_00200 [Alphaproteobacteria bacterium]|nr:hypothetical protein [Alphaproteobacteria bacterium]
MTELKCPFCGNELEHNSPTGICCCKSIFLNCPAGLGNSVFGTTEMWQILIILKKALDEAKNTISWYCDSDSPVVAIEALKTIEIITKDLKCFKK